MFLFDGDLFVSKVGFSKFRILEKFRITFTANRTSDLLTIFFRLRNEQRFELSSRIKKGMNLLVLVLFIIIVIIICIIIIINKH